MFEKKYNMIMVIPDLHISAHHKESFKFLKAVRDKYEPDLVIFLGDVVDFHSLSYHEKDPDLPSPKDEIVQVRKYVQELSQIFPEAICIMGNHDKLIQRKAVTAGLPKYAVKELSEIIKSPHGWRWVGDYKANTIKGPVYFTHGRTSTINKMAQLMGMSSCSGHYHSKFYVSYFATPMGIYFDANFGCLIDKDHKAFLYSEQSIGKPVLGCGIIKMGRAILVPMYLKRHGKWTGEL